MTSIRRLICSNLCCSTVYLTRLGYPCPCADDPYRARSINKFESDEPPMGISPYCYICGEHFPANQLAKGWLSVRCKHPNYYGKLETQNHCGGCCPRHYKEE